MELVVGTGIVAYTRIEGRLLDQKRDANPLGEELRSVVRESEFAERFEGIGRAGRVVEVDAEKRVLSAELERLRISDVEMVQLGVTLGF
jgi:hypothetical protein